MFQTQSFKKEGEIKSVHVTAMSWKKITIGLEDIFNLKKSRTHRLGGGR